MSTSIPTPSFTLTTVDWHDPRAVEFRRVMDVEMTARYAGYSPVPESAETIARRNASLAVDPATVRATVLVLDADQTPLAHAALRMLGDEWEIKRVIVSADHRGRGMGGALLAHLEQLARVGGARRVILQTGDRQPDAVALYERVGYTPIPIYEPYVETIPNSLCFERVL
jgi:GNAT superfamily N-acetyltransferase